MTYELASALRRAGFSQQDRDGLYLKETFNARGEHEFGYGNEDGEVYVPTLPELIEACGRNFNALRHLTDDTWEALGNELSRAFGATPEEAVAKLWIALNKKP